MWLVVGYWLVRTQRSVYFAHFYSNARNARVQLGFKTALGMPFRDIATVDSVYLQEVPAADDHTARTTLRRMQEVRKLA